MSLGDLHFKDEVDVGHFLTFITLVAGFIWWLYSATRNWRERSLNEARSGALRLLLKLLREAPNQQMELQALFDAFKSDANATLRLLYCGRRFKFDSFPPFETAIYRLNYESKVDFATATRVVFRTEGGAYDRWRKFVPTDEDRKEIMAIFVAAISEPGDYVVGLNEVADTAMRLAPDETVKILRQHLKDPDDKMKRRAASLIGRLIPVT